MDVIDNGRLRRLTVPRLFDGEAGESDGVIAFVPNVVVRQRRPQFCNEGILDGVLVKLTFVGWEGPFVTFRYAEQR